MKRLAVSILAFSALTAWAAEWKPARPDYPWSFPQDHWARPGYKTGWWYFTGHLASASGRRFGYQFTLFRVGLLPARPGLDSDWSAQNLIMGHAAISDPASGRHLFSEVLYRAVPLLGGFGAYPDTLIAWSRGPAGTDARWTLRWNGEAFDFSMADRAQKMAFALSTRPARPLVFQGPGGYSRKGDGPTAASQYYSFTRLETEGIVRLDGAETAVWGTSWMDREFFTNQLESHQTGWDWFSIQLSDGRDIMLYTLRDGDGRVDAARGTLVSPDGGARYLDRADFSVRATQTWRSEKTGAVYPAQWIVELPAEGLRIILVPELADQENRSRTLPTLFYWEGAVRALDAARRPVGQGYVELVGYGTKSRPAL